MLDAIPHEILHKIILHGREPVLNKLLSIPNRQLVSKCSHPHVSGMLMRKKVKRNYISFLCKNGHTQIIKLVLAISRSTLAITSQHMRLAIGNANLGTARYLLNRVSPSQLVQLVPKILDDYAGVPSVVSTMMYLGMHVSATNFLRYSNNWGNLRSFLEINVRSNDINWLLPIAISSACLPVALYFVATFTNMIPLKETLELCIIKNNLDVVYFFLFQYGRTAVDVQTFENLIVTGSTMDALVFTIFSFGLSDGIISHQTLMDLCIRSDRLQYLQKLIVLITIPFQMQHLDFAIVCRAWNCADYIRSTGIAPSGSYLPLNWSFKEEELTDIVRYIALGLAWPDPTELWNLALQPSYERVLVQILKSSLYSKSALQYYSNEPWMLDRVHQLLYNRL